MADIEESSSRAYGLMLLQNTAILYRHLPAAKIHQASSELTMLFIQRSTFQLRDIVMRRHTKITPAGSKGHWHLAPHNLQKRTAFVASRYLKIVCQRAGRIYRNVCPSYGFVLLPLYQIFTVTTMKRDPISQINKHGAHKGTMLVY